MKSPDNSNLDQWLFHYFEGDLSASDEAMLEDFLLEHPEHDSLFEVWGGSRINQTFEDYPARAALLKPLFNPLMLNRVAVFTAIGINLTLAALLIFGDYAVLKDNSAKEFIELPQFNFAAQQNSNSTDVNASALTERTISGENLVNSANVISNNGFTLENTNTSLSFGNPEFNELSESQDSHIDRSIEPSENSAPILAIQSNDHSTVQSQSVELQEIASSVEGELEAVEEFVVHEENTTDVKQNSSESSSANVEGVPNNIKSRSEVREKKLFHSKNRFKSGDLLLTNSRNPGYLVPGMTSNQINFAHTASDFSNTLYSNSYIQWPGQQSAMVSNLIGFDAFLPNAKSGIGIQMLYNRSFNGSINQFELAATYSPKFFLTKNIVLEPAVRFKMGGTGINRTEITPGTWVEFDRPNSFVYAQQQQNAQVNRSIQQDFGLGFLLNTKWGFVGANADNLMGSKNQALHFGNPVYESRNPLFFNAVAGTEYESLNKKLRWSGHLVYQRSGDLNKFWFGTRVKYNFLSLGASVSSTAEPMMSLGLMFRDLSLFYSTDYAYSRLSEQRHLSHQLTVRILLKEGRLKKLMLN